MKVARAIGMAILVLATYAWIGLALYAQATDGPDCPYGNNAVHDTGDFVRYCP